MVKCLKPTTDLETFALTAEFNGIALKMEFRRTPFMYLCLRKKTYLKACWTLAHVTIAPTRMDVTAGLVSHTRLPEREGVWICMQLFRSLKRTLSTLVIVH